MSELVLVLVAVTLMLGGLLLVGLRSTKDKETWWP